MGRAPRPVPACQPCSKPPWKQISSFSGAFQELMLPQDRQYDGIPGDAEPRQPPLCPPHHHHTLGSQMSHHCSRLNRKCHPQARRFENGLYLTAQFSKAVETSGWGLPGLACSIYTFCFLVQPRLDSSVTGSNLQDHHQGHQSPRP